MSTFSKNLKKIRKEKGITMVDMANRLNMPYTTYRNYEEGREPKIGIIRKIAETLDVPIGELVTDWASFSHEEIAIDWAAPSKNDLLKHYQKLNTQGKRKVVDYAADMAKIPEYQDQPEEQKESLPDDQEGNDDTNE